MMMQTYQMMRDTQLRLDKCNVDEGKTVITQYKGKNIVMWQSTRTQEDGMQRKDLVGLRGT
jgi:hypothetical protein